LSNLLSEEDVVEHLSKIPEWNREGKEIKRKWKFKNFIGSMGFINQVALLSEKMDHHPDIVINWNRVSLSLSTHSEGGLTELDFKLAKKN